MKNVKVAIVGIFFDGYYDIWEDFLELFFEKWPDCPYPLYIVNNERDISFDKKYSVSVLHAGMDAEYSRKIQLAVKEIEADYYLLLLEDFFMQKKLDADVLDSIMSYIEKNHLKYYRMNISDFQVLGAKKTSVGPERISGKDEYTLSCQPSIWEREFLKDCIGTENYNAWIFEGIYAFSKRAHEKTFLDQCRVDYANPLSIRHGAVQGKMLPTVYADFAAEGYVFKNKREILDSVAYKKHLNKQIIKEISPLSIQRFIKKHIKTQSVLDKYKDEIQEIMRKMNIE